MTALEGKTGLQMEELAGELVYSRRAKREKKQRKRDGGEEERAGNGRTGTRKME